VSVVLESVVPLFAVIFLGFFAGRAGFLGEAGIRGLGAFVFNFAIPPHVFRLMAETDLDQITEWGFLGGYLLAQSLVFVSGATIARLAFGMGVAEMTIQAFGSTFSNGVMLALPLLLWLYGDAGGVPALLIITLDVIVFSSVTVLLELGRRRGGRVGSRVVAQAARAVLVNPIIMATVLGILYSLSGRAFRAVRARRLAQPAPHHRQSRPRGHHGGAQAVPASFARLARSHLPARARPVVAQRRRDLRRLSGRPERLRVRAALRCRDRDRVQRDPDLDRARHGHDYDAPCARPAALTLEHRDPERVGRDAHLPRPAWRAASPGGASSRYAASYAVRR
jgi:hypothetical protein